MCTWETGISKRTGGCFFTLICAPRDVKRADEMDRISVPVPVILVTHLMLKKNNICLINRRYQTKLCKFMVSTSKDILITRIIVSYNRIVTLTRRHNYMYIQVRYYETEWDILLFAYFCGCVLVEISALAIYGAGTTASTGTGIK